MMAKDNQPQLCKWIKALFDEPQWLRELPQMAESLDLGLGQIEKRRLKTSSALSHHGLWPGLAQVFVIEREVTQVKSGKRSQEMVYGCTSLSKERASAEMLLKLERGHWAIENQSHWVRDVTMDEDRSQVRKGNILEVMAALRNTVIGLLRKAGEGKIAAACRSARIASQNFQVQQAITSDHSVVNQSQNGLSFAIAAMSLFNLQLLVEQVS